MSEVPLNPKVLGVQIPSAARDYAYRWLDLGAIEGPVGNMQLSPELIAIMEAIHHVLAGGEAVVEIKEAGAAPIVEELDSMLNDMLEHGFGDGTTST